MENSSMPIFITENGLSRNETSFEVGINDAERIDFHFNYLSQIAIIISSSNLISFPLQIPTTLLDVYSNMAMLGPLTNLCK